MADSNLNAGFTGNIDGQADTITEKAKGAVDVARREAGAVAAAAVDHPTAASGAILLAGLVGLAIGYALGNTGSSASRHRYW